MHPTPPGPLGDCLRDWEELQQDFQSIQVSDHAGAHWPRALSLWLGVIGRAAVCLAAGNSGQELGTLASFLRAARPGIPGSRLDSPLGLMSVSDGGTLRPHGRGDPGGPHCARGT